MSSISVNDYKYSSESNEIEKKIYEVKNNDFDIFENKEDFIIYKIENIDSRKPNINDNQTKEEILELVNQKNKFDYNRKLLEKIRDKKFTENDFLKFGKDNIQSIILNSVKDNKKFEINSIKVLYSLPLKSFTLINDEDKNVYLAKVIKYNAIDSELDTKDFDLFYTKENTRIKNDILRSYDLYLNKKYNVNINQIAVNNVKNLFQ